MKKYLVLLLYAGLTACAPVGLVNGVSRVYSADAEFDLRYGELPRQKFDLYMPAKPSSESATPIIVFFHGGSWNFGDKSIYPFIGRRLADAGYIVAIPNYRLYPEISYPDFLKDCALAVSAIDQRLRQPEYVSFNPDTQLFLMGHSAGAYNAAMLSLDKRWLAEVAYHPEKILKGWIGIAGPYDLYPIEVPAVKPVFHYPNYPPNSNPIELIGNTNIPALIIAPENDNLVDTAKNSYAFAKRMSEHHIETELVTLKSTNHISIIGTFSPMFFFKQSLLPPVRQFIESFYETQP